MCVHAHMWWIHVMVRGQLMEVSSLSTLRTSEIKLTWSVLAASTFTLSPVVNKALEEVIAAGVAPQSQDLHPTCQHFLY